MILLVFELGSNSTVRVTTCPVDHNRSRCHFDRQEKVLRLYVYATPHSIVTLNFALVYSGTPLLKVIYRDSEPLTDILVPRTY